MTRTVSGVTWHSYFSDEWRPLEERQDTLATAAAQYLWGARHRDDLVRRDRATTSGASLDETRYVLTGYFSPASIVDQTGTVTERYAFSAFGVRTVLAPDFSPITSSECSWDLAFQGQILDAETGMLDYGYRYYSASLGRWLSRDPIGEDGSTNLYGFVSNQPTAFLDLFGAVAAEGVPKDLVIPNLPPYVTQLPFVGTLGANEGRTVCTINMWQLTVSPKTPCGANCANCATYTLASESLSFSVWAGNPVQQNILNQEAEHVQDWINWFNNWVTDYIGFLQCTKPDRLDCFKTMVTDPLFKQYYYQSAIIASLNLDLGKRPPMDHGHKGNVPFETMANASLATAKTQQLDAWKFIYYRTIICNGKTT